MLKSCKYCGRIHDDKVVCEQKKDANNRRWQNRKQTRALQFRRSNAWTEKSQQIRKRDRYMCLCCKAQMIGTVVQYNTRDISVHHIIPIEEEYDRRLDDDNLITVCPTHHEMCERGDITRDEQRRLALDSAGEGGWYVPVL
jgi:5-methylcytosine-specific restriction endonuclease McrA